MACPIEYRADFRRETSLINLSRIRTITLVMTILSTLATLYLWFERWDGPHNTVPFYISMHMANSLVGLSFWLWSAWAAKSTDRSGRYGPGINLLFSCYVLAWAVLFSLLSQSMNGQITVYIIGLTSVAIMTYTNPGILAILFILANSLLNRLMPFFQTSPIQSASHLINSIYLTAAAWLVATILYNSRINDYRQKQVINQQFNELIAANQKLELLSTIDALTGIFNRRVFDESIDREWRRACRQKTLLAVALIDVDHFKDYNDSYGHLAGDTCLQVIAATIARQVKRPGDGLFRYGGEEFAIIMSDTNLEGAKSLCEKIRLEVENLAIPHLSSEFSRVSISVGVASTLPDPDQPYSGFIKRVDLLLYEAKKQGRNRVVDPLDHLSMNHSAS